MVAKLLYVAIRARGDILLAVSFLCTRVSKSTTQDQAKLKRLLEYLSGTLHHKYILGADDLKSLRTWVDASYAVHPDMKSHTGGVMSFGTGGFVCKSSKQKLNTKSSTEAEVVGASDYLPNTLWIQMFLAAQGYELESNFFEQDNESAMKLEKNGRMSAGQKSRHIDIRYFWIKDRTEANKINIRHCPTIAMLADFFTKPLQGHLFRHFRDVIMGHCHVDTLRLSHNIPAEERVEEDRSETFVTEKPSVVNEKTTVPSTGACSAVTWADVVIGKTRMNEVRTIEKETHGKTDCVENTFSKQSSQLRPKFNRPPLVLVNSLYRPYYRTVEFNARIGIREVFFATLFRERIVYASTRYRNTV